MSIQHSQTERSWIQIRLWLLVGAAVIGLFFTGKLIRADELDMPVESLFVFDQIAVGGFFLFPTALFHGGGGGGVLGSFDSDEIGGVDGRKLEINFGGFSGIPVLQRMAGQFVHEFYVLGRGVQRSFQRECGDLGQIGGHGGIPQ